MKLSIFKSADLNGLISINDNALIFDADLPKKYAVDYIRINGKFALNNGIEHENILLNDIECEKIIDIRRELAHKAYNPERMLRELATVYFANEIPADLVEKVTNGIITDFEIYAHEEWFCAEGYTSK